MVVKNGQFMLSGLLGTNIEALYNFVLTPASQLAEARSEAGMEIGIFSTDLPQIVYVGDAVVDIQAGKAAGMRTAGVTWAAATIPALAAADPDYLFTDADELRQLAPAAVIER